MSALLGGIASGIQSLGSSAVGRAASYASRMPGGVRQVAGVLGSRALQGMTGSSANVWGGAISNYVMGGSLSGFGNIGRKALQSRPVVGMLAGTAFGGVKGAFSDDTSVLGGMASYGAAGFIGGHGSRLGSALGAATRAGFTPRGGIPGIGMALPLRYAKLQAHRAINEIKGFSSQVGRAWNLGAGRY